MRRVLSKNPQVEQQRLHRRAFFDTIDPENQALQVSCAHLSLNCVSEFHSIVHELVYLSIMYLFCVQILISCFVKTSHFEEYLRVKASNSSFSSFQSSHKGLLKLKLHVICFPIFIYIPIVGTDYKLVPCWELKLCNYI